jgi:RPA family protein
MSSSQNRETAYRVFAAEFDDASLSYAESDEERAPNYVVTPTGARINRLFAVGVLTEIESVNDEQLRARIVDPTGAFVVYAGQYQPDALSFLERAETRAFVAVTGKARTFQPEDSERVFTSIRPETLNEVDAATRDRFTVDTAERTVERVDTMQDALDRDERDDALRAVLENEGVETGLAAGIPRALSHYGTTPAYLDAVREMALDAARVVAGKRDEVGPLDVAPDEGGAADRTALADAGDTDETGPTAATATATDEERTESVAETTSETAAPSASESESSGDTDEPAAAETMAESERPDSGTDIETTTDSGTETDELDGETDLDDPEEFELDDEVRERIEDQYGTDFESAAEVGEPGEADIETPTPDSTDESEPVTSETPTVETTETARTDTTNDTEPDDVGSDEADAGTESDETDESAESEASGDTDPEEAVVTVMHELDDGDGADREAVIERVVEDYGLGRDAAEDGIQSALMSGECYEPDDDTLKPI